MQARGGTVLYSFAVSSPVHPVLSRPMPEPAHTFVVAADFRQRLLECCAHDPLSGLFEVPESEAHRGWRYGLKSRERQNPSGETT